MASDVQTLKTRYHSDEKLMKCSSHLLARIWGQIRVQFGHSFAMRQRSVASVRTNLDITLTQIWLRSSQGPGDRRRQVKAIILASTI